MDDGVDRDVHARANGRRGLKPDRQHHEHVQMFPSCVGHAGVN